MARLPLLLHSRTRHYNRVFAIAGCPPQAPGWRVACAPRAHGGISRYPPSIQTAIPRFLNEGHVVPTHLITRGSRCQRYGVPLHARALPYLQLGPIPYNAFQFLAKAFSIARRFVLDGLASQSQIGQPTARGPGCPGPAPVVPMYSY